MRAGPHPFSPHPSPPTLVPDPMKRLLVLFTLVTFALNTTACGQTASDLSPAERKARILSNLVFEFPQLEQYRVEIGDIEPTDIEGLSQGTFTINGQQTQLFLVTDDDTQLFMVSADPVDVSRSADGLTAARAEREQAAAAEVSERREQLNEALADLPVRGNPNAPVTIVEFSDFQCPYCSRAFATVEQVLAKYPEDVRLVYAQFPLNNHPWARPASIAALCAAQQDPDAFWTLHDGYFRNQSEINPGNVTAKSRDFLTTADVDVATWATCTEDASSDAHQKAVATLDANMALGEELGVTGTPGFFVNGRFVNGAQPLEAFEALIEEAKGDS